MKQVFADTFFFFALLSAHDEAHFQAVQFAEHFHGKIVTTPWVITELADGMAKNPSQRTAFLRFLKAFRANPNFKELSCAQDLFDEGLSIYRQRPDKEWSLTDCISFAAMKQYALSEALTGDRHFEQAGFVCLLATV